jgi:hypothetical protein
MSWWPRMVWSAWRLPPRITNQGAKECRRSWRWRPSSFASTRQTTMTTERTELEWPYQPEDLFEVAYHYAGSEYDVLIEKGRAVATLKVPQDPIDEQLEKRIKGHVRAILQVRQLQTHRPYELQGLRVYQHSGGRKNIAIRVLRCRGAGRGSAGHPYPGCG